MESFGKIEEVNMVGYFQLLLLFAVKHFSAIKIREGKFINFYLKLQVTKQLMINRR